MGERLFYLPSGGLCLLAGILYERVALTMDEVRRSRFDVRGSSLIIHRSSFILRLLVVVLCLALTARTIVRNLDWFSDQTAFQSALRVVPGSAKVHSTLGILALPGQNWDDANASFKTALHIYPTYSLTDADLMTKMGAALLGKGEVEDAMDTLERAVALEHDNRFAQYNLGLAYAQAGRYEDAERSYRRALALDPTDADTYNSLSYVLTKQERYREAEEMAVDAIKSRSDFAEAHYNKGRALEGQGRINEAVAEYKRVVEITPTADRVRARLNRLLAKGVSSGIPFERRGWQP
jgi:tetratricopeptide (TPR) repeat protein